MIYFFFNDKFILNYNDNFILTIYLFLNQNNKIFKFLYQNNKIFYFKDVFFIFK